MERYCYSCDWYSLGVMLYELAERAYPYGEAPEFASVEDEFVNPKLVGDDGVTEVSLRSAQTHVGRCCSCQRLTICL